MLDDNVFNVEFNVIRLIVIVLSVVAPFNSDGTKTENDGKYFFYPTSASVKKTKGQTGGNVIKLFSFIADDEAK
jgi:hypothetical protein